MYKYIELVSSSNRFSDKFSRAKKLLNNWDNIEEKLFRILNRGFNNLSHNFLCSWAVLVMMKTGIRVGNEKSAEGYVSINKYSKHFNKKIKTYGITTILIRHCKIVDNRVVLNFIGKKAVEQTFVIEDEYLVNSFRAISYGKGKNDRVLNISHYDLTKFVKKYIGKKYCIKDIRTARVNLEFIREMKNNENVKFTTKRDNNRLIMNCVEKVANKIGHTKAVCKNSYISKELITIWKNKLNTK